MKLRSSPLLLVLLVLVLLGAFVGIQVLRHAEPPRDEKLVDRFQRDRADFDELRRLFSEDSAFQAIRTDGAFRVDPRVQRDAEPDKSGLSAERFKAYRALFRRLKLQSVTRATDGLHFPLDGFGFGREGWRLELVYGDPPADQVVGSLDEYRGPARQQRRSLARRLDDRWYARLTW
ncbi:MAG: hypothetical protein JSR82_07730 [Verrucomicrobia bacterium]|nr:hypothetical protein [Verrucomicrobiota bacterium]